MLLGIDVLVLSRWIYTQNLENMKRLPTEKKIKRCNKIIGEIN